ncbi:patatin-like phospholipase family protein [endosymbiont of Lamellibrachia barhami]|uniref:patatin-like phospholipase family protein n=1 Tax=endosymbiont of Lamellibrachia barhami TaxID=205975 RepID=UPI0015A96C7E|nr:patatin-like phospholipase family protein [endosymbiont of Lamellibrachia barhami]
MPVAVKRILLALLLLCQLPTALAQQQIERPKIGLALSGGGARGAAHVGILKVLEALRIPIDYIAGTSMGAIIGGLYASGMSPETIEQHLTSMDWENLFDDDLSRTKHNMRGKINSRLPLINAKLGVKEREISLPTAMIQGQKFSLELKRLTLGVSEITDFSRLPIPFRAVATEIATGNPIILSKGDLALAIQASMTIPGVFAGVEIENRLLVDGGVSNNLPIDVVREMGADIVIAVDISTPLYHQDELTTALTIVEQLTTILTRRNTETQIAALSDRDILIIPALDDIESADFKQTGEAIRIGKVAAEAIKPALSRLALGEQAYHNYREKRRIKPTTPIVEFIRVENQSELRDELLSSRLSIHSGAPLDLIALEQSIDEIYGLDIFESVRYRLIEEAGKTGLLIKAKEKRWGTDFLQFGLNFSVNPRLGDSHFNASSAYTIKPLNDLNGELKTFVQLGREPTLFTELYQPLDSESEFFVHPILFYSTQYVGKYLDDNLVAEYGIKKYGVGLSAGRELGKWGRIELGYRRFLGDLDYVAGPPKLQGYDFSGGELYGSFKLDEVDDIYFPREGFRSTLRWTGSRRSLGADNDFDQFELQFNLAKSWDDHTLFATGSLNSTQDDNAPLQDRFTLGGFLHLSGLSENQIIGQHTALLVGSYMFRLHRSKYFPVYAGASLEMGNAWQSRDDISLNDMRYASSLYLGADTPVGPLYFAYGHAEGGQYGFYLFLRRPLFMD